MDLKEGLQLCIACAFLIGVGIAIGVAKQQLASLVKLDKRIGDLGEKLDALTARVYDVERIHRDLRTTLIRLDRLDEEMDGVFKKLEWKRRRLRRATESEEFDG